MKTTQTLSAFFPAIRLQLTQLQLDVENNPATWRAKLQAAIDQGAFLKIEFGYGLAGVIDARLLVVSKDGEKSAELSIAEAENV